MKSYLIGLSLLLSFSTVAVAQEPVLQGKDHAEVKKVCDQLFAVYEKYSHNAFIDLVSEGMLPSKPEFIKIVEAGVASENVLGFEYSIIMALVPGNQMMAQIRWDKKYQLKSAEVPTLETGTTMLVFRKEDSSWKLVQLMGDDPF